jgi:ATP-binding cassette subfamily B protein
MEKKDPRQPIDVRQAVRNVIRAFLLVWRAHPAGALAMAVITVIMAGIPLAQAWMAKLIIDGVAAAATSGQLAQAGFWRGIQPVLPYLLGELGMVTLSALASQVRSLVEHVLHARLAHQVNTAIIRKSLQLDLQFFEDATFYDQLKNARREADWRALSILNTSFYALQNLLQLASFAVVLVAFSPWVALILFGASLPMFVAQARFSRLQFRLLSWRAPESRRMSYFEHLLTDKESVKEVKLFGLGNTLLDNYVGLFWKFYAEDSKMARKRSMISVGFGLMANVAYYVAYAWVVWRAAIGVNTLGDMALYLALFRGSQGAFQGLLGQVNTLYESALFMNNLFGFLELTPVMSRPANPAKPGVIRDGIEFRDVSFKYPNKPDWALRHVNLHIKPGEKLALVGANGAGKTTFIKLLTRLYDPTEGQILLDGRDLRDYDPDALRDAIGVIFQDFVRYMATARENIGYGQVNAIDDQPRIERAAEQGGADAVVAELPERYETTLGVWFDRGRELSGGQWQKMALGRAFMRDAQVLVLDEPTSALDAEREYEIFQRFRELTAGKIAILISHRFSTVRMADRIAVIENGAISELGSHDALLALDGTYARLFNMQAQGYR